MGLCSPVYSVLESASSGEERREDGVCFNLMLAFALLSTVLEEFIDSYSPGWGYPWYFTIFD